MYDVYIVFYHCTFSKLTFNAVAWATGMARIQYEKIMLRSRILLF